MSARVLFAWDGEVLHLRTFQRDLRIRWAPEPRAEERDTAGALCECWPEFRMLRPPDAPADDSFFDLGPEEAAAESARGALAGQKARAFAGFRDALPAELVARAEHFPSHQWPMLQLMHGRAEVRDLAGASPVLAFALANNGEFRGTSSDVSAAAARRHCHHKQREIAGWLGFPATDAAVRILRKIPAEAATPSRLRLLRKLLRTRSERVRTLSTLPRLNAGVIELLGLPRLDPFVTDALLQQVLRHPAEERRGEVAWLLTDILRMEQQTGRRLSRDEVRSISAAHAMHQSVLAVYLEHVEREARAERIRQEERLRRDQAEAKRKADGAAGLAPPPPLPGNDGIQPLTTRAELQEESRRQGNCVGGYFRRVCRGRCYIYRVTRPERATLAIRQGASGRWYREQIKGPRNQRVRRETELTVDLWLSRTQNEMERRGMRFLPPAEMRDVGDGDLFHDPDEG